eukprot:g80067.t1
MADEEEQDEEEQDEEEKAPAVADPAVEPLVQQMTTLVIAPFVPHNPQRMIPKFGRGLNLSILYKRDRPLNPLIEFDTMRARGYVANGYLEKKAIFGRAESKSGNVAVLQCFGLFVLFVSPLQEDERIYVFAHRGSLNNFIRRAETDTFLNIYTTIANYAP